MLNLLFSQLNGGTSPTVKSVGSRNQKFDEVAENLLVFYY